MALSIRQSEILDLARSEGKVLVDDLAGRFGVTLQTIRRDLTELADAGRLDCVHGGAILRAGVANIGYAERRSLNAEAKAAIARTCAAAIPDNSSLFLNIGTTTEAVARASGSPQPDSRGQQHECREYSGGQRKLQCDRGGGVLRRSDGGLVGDLTTAAIAAFKVDFAIIGTSGLDGDGDLLDFDSQEVRVSRAILRQSRQSFLVADASKLGRAAPVRIASLSELDAVFTDHPLPEPLTTRCRDWQTAIRLPV